MDPIKDSLEFNADILGCLAQVCPGAPLGNLKPVVLGQVGEALVALVGLEGDFTLGAERVADPLEEEEREDIRLEVGWIDRAAQ